LSRKAESSGQPKKTFFFQQKNKVVFGGIQRLEIAPHLSLFQAIQDLIFSDFEFAKKDHVF
jgi:hypothetical protein